MENEVKDYDIELPSPPAVVLDIGANVGAYTARCLKRWPKAQIIAYEPARHSAEAFRKNFGKLANVQLHQVAVRDYAGPAALLEADLSVAYGFHQLGRQGAAVYNVECISAAELPKADLIKIDTEGCEVEILSKLDTSGTMAIVCEWHREEDLVAIKKALTDRGFVLHGEKEYAPSNGVLKFIRPYDKAKSPVKLFIGIPVYSTMMTQFNHCLLALQANKPCHIELHTGQGDGVARTRNALTADFLKTDCTHLLMIDCDLIFSAEHVARIVSHDVDVVGGFYPKKQEGPLEWVINTFPGPIERRADDLHKVAYIGTGFMCVKRRVFEMMIEKYPHIAFGADYGKRDTQHDLWPMSVYCAECGAAAGPQCKHEPTSRRYLSEDWYFCQRWMDLGGEVFGDTRVILRHIGPAIFPLETQLTEIANPRPKPKAVEDDLVKQYLELTGEKPQ